MLVDSENMQEGEVCVEDDGAYDDEPIDRTMLIRCECRTGESEN
jgi:hypothetical protein